MTVADAQGLSYYSDQSLGRSLSTDSVRLSKARGDLMRAGLIAYQRPLYQVLALDSPPRIEVRELSAEEIAVRLSRLRAAMGLTP